MMFRLLLLLCLGHCLSTVLGTELSFDTEIGATVMLPCNGSTVKDMNNIHWRFDSGPLGAIKHKTWKANDPRYRLPYIEKNNFSLVINPVKEKDDGTYICRESGTDIQSIRLIVKESQTQTPVTPTKGSRNQTVSVLPTPGPPPGVIVVIVLVVLVVVAVGAAVLIKLWRKRQTDENPTDCIQFFYACGKEGEKNRGKNLPDPGPSEDALI